MTGQRYKIACSSLAVVAAVYASQASAQEAAATPAIPASDIVVTAQRRSERIQDVPASIAAIGGQTLATQQINNLAQALVSVPNVQVSLPYGEGGPPNFSIRGISSTDFSFNVSKPIAINLNDSIRNLQVFEIQPLFDIERVEILRGPQGTLYGRNATAGAINIITQAPKFEQSGYVTLGYGSFETWRGEGAVNGEIVPGVLAARLAVMYSSDDGVYKNLEPGYGNLMQTKMWNVRPSLRFKSGIFDATLRFSHVESTGRNNATKSLNYDPAYNGVAWTNNDAAAGFYKNYTSYPGRHDLLTDGFNLSMSLTPENYTIQSITSYDWGHMLDDASGSGTELNQLLSVSQSTASQFVQEYRLVSNYHGPFNWQGGLSYYYDRVAVTNFYDFPLFDFTENNSFLQKREGIAGYLGADLKLGAGLKAHGGVRRSYDHLKVSNYDAYFDGVATFLDQGLSKNFHNTSFDAGLDWKVQSDVLLYGSFKEAYRMGALNGQAFTSPAEVQSSAPPETAKSFEIGVKSQFFNRLLTLNVALSTTQYRNQQVVDFSTGIAQLVSLPSARVNALEAEATVTPHKGIVLSGSLGLLDAKYTANAPGYDINGNQLGLASKVTGTLSGSADLFTVPAGALSVRADASYRSKSYADFTNEEAVAMGNFWLANAGIRWNAGKYSLNGGVKNLFNKAYWTTGTASGFAGYSVVQRGMPRQFSIDLTYLF